MQVAHIGSPALRSLSTSSVRLRGFNFNSLHISLPVRAFCSPFFKISAINSYIPASCFPSAAAISCAFLFQYRICCAFTFSGLLFAHLRRYSFLAALAAWFNSTEEKPPFLSPAGGAGSHFVLASACYASKVYSVIHVFINLLRILYHILKLFTITIFRG